MKRTRYTREVYEVWDGKNNAEEDPYSLDDELYANNDYLDNASKDVGDKSTRSGFTPQDNGRLKVLVAYFGLIGLFFITVLLSGLARPNVQNIRIDQVNGDNNRFEFLQEK